MRINELVAIGVLVGAGIYSLLRPVQEEIKYVKNTSDKPVCEYRCGNGIKYEIQQEKIVKDIVDKLVCDDGQPGCGGPPRPRPIKPELPIPPIPPGPYLDLVVVQKPGFWPECGPDGGPVGPLDGVISCTPRPDDDGYSCPLCNSRFPIDLIGPRIDINSYMPHSIAGVITGNYRTADVDSIKEISLGGGDGVGI